MIVLGIETSCDETSAAVVQDGNILLSNVVLSSMDLHVIYGGVVPEIAARSHIESIIPVIDQALQEAFGNYPLSIGNKLSIDDEQLSSKGKKLKANSRQIAKGQRLKKFDPWDQIDAIAVTYGAGLGGSLLVGVMTAKTLAITKNKPLYAINHVEGHVYANFITEIGVNPKSEARNNKLEIPKNAPEFPMLALIVSGGHSQLVLFRNHFDYTLLGQTRDDAIGEAFDKVAKITGLPYPGGPSVAEAALLGDPLKYKLPKSKLEGQSESLEAFRKINYSPLSISDELAINDEPLSSKGKLLNDNSRQIAKGQRQMDPIPKNYDFSFSGLKTAVLRLAQELVGQDYTFPSHKLPEALSETQKNDIAANFQRVAIETVVDKTVLAFKEFQPKSVVIAGGVAANQELRRQLSDKIPIPVQYPDIKLCTDNAAMIASLGCFKMKHNQAVADPYTLQIEPNLSM